jgi:hypothetical protein
MWQSNQKKGGIVMSFHNLTLAFPVVAAISSAFDSASQLK